jgi:DNA-binding winged helix-turn-helix (wHTH) protein
VSPRCVGFGIFELDLASGDLRRAGMRRPLPPQSFKLLAALLARPGEVVSREELRTALWGDSTYVDFDHGLNFCVNQLRRSLGDAARNPRFIETVPRLGYRFLAPVTLGPVTRAPALPLPPRRRLPVRWIAPALAAWLASQAGGGPLAAGAPPREPGPAVREAYLRGLDHARAAPSQWPQAAQWLERAVLEDPAFGPAQAALAGIYVRLAEQRLRAPREVLPLAGYAARAALEADALDAEAHLWAGMAALHGDWDWATAGREIRRAIDLDPRLVAARRAHAVYLSAQGDDAGALREIEEARRLDPLCSIVTGEAAWYRYRAGRPDEAATLWRAAAALRADLGLHESLLLLYGVQGRAESAAEEAVRAMRLAGVPEASLADVSQMPPPQAVQAYLRGAIRTLDGQGAGAPPERLAVLHAALGDEDAAVAQLARACAERSFALPRALRDPAFDRIRADPRFREIAIRVGTAS